MESSFLFYVLGYAKNILKLKINNICIYYSHKCILTIFN